MVILETVSTANILISAKHPAFVNNCLEVTELSIATTNNNTQDLNNHARKLITYGENKANRINFKIKFNKSKAWFRDFYAIQPGNGSGLITGNYRQDQKTAITNTATLHNLDLSQAEVH